MPPMTKERVVATLGGPGTFAGQATAALVARTPGLGPVRYLPTMDEVWAAACSGEADSVVLTSETSNTGLQEIAERLLRPQTGLHVNGEILVPYHCMLLGKPGTRLEDIRLVLGHGSLVHCRRFLAESLPRAQVRVHEKNSLAAAAEVLAGSGDTAVIGTALSARKNGLAIIEADVDLGSVGAWWIMSRELRVSPEPDVVVIGVPSSSGAALSGLLSRAQAAGLGLRGVAAVSTGKIFSYDYLVSLRADGVPTSVADELARMAGCRLIGAFETASAG
jgi:prephenate dehydratase